MNPGCRVQLLGNCGKVAKTLSFTLKNTDELRPKFWAILSNLQTAAPHSIGAIWVTGKLFYLSEKCLIRGTEKVSVLVKWRCHVRLMVSVNGCEWWNKIVSDFDWGENEVQPKKRNTSFWLVKMVDMRVFKSPLAWMKILIMVSQTKSLDNCLIFVCLHLLPKANDFGFWKGDQGFVLLTYDPSEQV